MKRRVSYSMFEILHFIPTCSSLREMGFLCIRMPSFLSLIKMVKVFQEFGLITNYDIKVCGLKLLQRKVCF